MNSYNENLHSNIVSSLSDQELEMQKSKAQRDASKFSLYYAQGATITAAERLEEASDEYKHQEDTYKEAVIDSDFSTNVLASAKSSKSFVDESVSNTSVAAANVQIATNAIVKLASDIGSVYNIVKAGDYGTEIYDQSEYANKVMSQTAYLAEKASERSMNTSASIAEVSTTSLEKKAEVTDNSIKNLLEVVRTNFVDKSDEVAADNEALASANTEEKAAEGTLEQNNVNYNAISDAYDMSNCELNLNLKVLVPEPSKNKDEFVVSFNRFEPAFPEPKAEAEENAPEGIDIGNPYPVDKYYVMMVKYDRSSIFSIANAEAIILEEEKNKDGQYRYFEVSPTLDFWIDFPFPIPMPGIPFTIAENHFTTPKLNYNNMLDSDGELMELGKNYVAFVFAKLSNDYKKRINTYDDYLSAPSKSFNITTYLNVVNSHRIKVLGGDKKETMVTLDEITGDFEIDKTIEFHYDISDNEKISIKDGKLVFQNELIVEVDAEIDGTVNLDKKEVIDIGGKQERDIEKGKQIVVFATPKEEDGPQKQYRCMFLLNDPDITKNLLTEDELEQIQKITDDKDEAVFLWTQKIQDILNKIQNKELEIGKNQVELDNVKLKISNPDKAPAKSTITKRDNLQSKIEKSKEEVKNFWQTLTTMLEAERIIIEQMDNKSEVPKFYFDLTIAEKVPYGSYTVVDKKIDVLGLFDLWYFQIQASTTDNFGNRLISDHEYIPAVLTISDNESYSENSKYTSALSKITSEGIFTYKSNSESE